MELFVYGRDPFHASRQAPTRYSARQSLAASQAIARLHGLDPQRVVFLPQNLAAIDAGVFHNDVIAVGNANVLLHHEGAFADERRRDGAYLSGLARHAPLITVRVSDVQLPLNGAVSSYLFNSQLLSRPDGQMMMICPAECQANEMARATLESIILRGSRLLATLGPIADELAVYHAGNHRFGADAQRQSFAFSVPCDAPGLRLLCRESFDVGRSRFDHPLGSRFEEMDATVFFNDVLAPWE